MNIINAIGMVRAAVAVFRGLPDEVGNMHYKYMHDPQNQQYGVPSDREIADQTKLTTGIVKMCQMLNQPGGLRNVVVAELKANPHPQLRATTMRLDHLERSTDILIEGSRLERLSAFDPYKNGNNVNKGLGELRREQLNAYARIGNLPQSQTMEIAEGEILSNVLTGKYQGIRTNYRQGGLPSYVSASEYQQRAPQPLAAATAAHNTRGYKPGVWCDVCRDWHGSAQGGQHQAGYTRPYQGAYQGTYQGTYQQGTNISAAQLNAYYKDPNLLGVYHLDPNQGGLWGGYQGAYRSTNPGAHPGAYQGAYQAGNTGGCLKRPYEYMYQGEYENGFYKRRG